MANYNGKADDCDDNINAGRVMTTMAAMVMTTWWWWQWRRGGNGEGGATVKGGNGEGVSNGRAFCSCSSLFYCMYVLI